MNVLYSFLVPFCDLARCGTNFKRLHHHLRCSDVAVKVFVPLQLPLVRVIYVPLARDGQLPQVDDKISLLNESFGLIVFGVFSTLLL